MKKTQKKIIALLATPEEQAKLQRLMWIYDRNTQSDMLRFLIANGEKILSKNNPIGGGKHPSRDCLGSKPMFTTKGDCRWEVTTK